MTAVSFPRITECTLVSFNLPAKGDNILTLSPDMVEKALMAIHLPSDLSGVVDLSAVLQCGDVVIANATVVQENLSGRISHTLSLFREKGPLTADQLLRMMQCRSDSAGSRRLWDDWSREMHEIADETKSAPSSKTSAA